MKNLKIIFLFQKTIFRISILIAVIAYLLIYLVDKDVNPLIIGNVYFFMAAITHFIKFEVFDKDECVFYYNLGFNKLKMWMSTFGLGVIIMVLCHLI